MRPDRGTWRRWRPGLLALLSLAALGALAASCAGGGGTEAQRETGEPTTSASTDDGPAPGGGPPDEGTARPSGREDGGVLRLAVEVPPTLDPARARLSAVGDLLLADLLFDGLTRYDPATLEPEPALAESFSPNEERTEWWFRLRPDAAFHDGRPITAADVKRSIERVVRLGARAPAGLRLESVVGYHDFAVSRTADELAGVVAMEDDLLRIDLERRVAIVPAVLASPVFGVVPPEADGERQQAFATRPVGSGPLRIETVESSTYRLAPADGAPLAIDAAEVRMVADPSEGYQAFVDGEVDWARVPASLVDGAAERFGTEHFSPFQFEVYLGFNLGLEKYRDVRFREAVVRAVDRRAVVGAVFGATARTLDGVVPRGVPGWEPDACGERCAHDPDAAQALLAEAFPDGAPPEVAIDVEDDAVQQAIAGAVAADLEEVGVTAHVRTHAAEEYQELVARGDHELFQLGWIGAALTPGDYLLAPFRSDSPENLVGLESEEVDAALAAARAEVDPERRRRRFRTAEGLILDRVPVLPLAQFQVHAVGSERLQGFSLTAAGTVALEQVRLERPA